MTDEGGDMDEVDQVGAPPSRLDVTVPRRAEVFLTRLVPPGVGGIGGGGATLLGWGKWGVAIGVLGWLGTCLVRTLRDPPKAAAWVDSLFASITLVVDSWREHAPKWRRRPLTGGSDEPDDPRGEPKLPVPPDGGPTPSRHGGRCHRHAARHE
jgi:hypothetical protein